MSDASLFPELDIERARLTFSRACRDDMIAMFEQVDPLDSADDFTAEYIEVTVEEALEDLRTPGAGEFFGRIDEDAANGGDSWYIGRRHIEDVNHDPVTIFVPLEYRTRADAQPLAHSGRNRDLTLRRDLRMCECHERILPR